ncbi:MAG: T9SS type A sorting domain-containing protein [Candidatus Cloacimonetes bacterium]|nr:T9SS type A sorting domain-containing protein [Candidatus Cloacimonadota bacterium]
MKKIVFYLLLFSTILLFSDEIIEYHFAYPEIREAGLYSEVIFENCLNIGKEGDPALPQLAASILLEAGTAAENVEVLSIAYYEDVRTLRLLPAGKPVPLSKMDDQPYERWESEIYSRQSNYPATRTSEPNTGFLCGHPLASFLVCPVEYTPLTGETRFLESITLKIKTAVDSKATAAESLLRHNNKIAVRLTNLVDNISALDYYSETPASRPEEYDILLITSEELLPHFAEYIQYKESCGYSVAALTTADIITQYPADDEQEAIRNAIIDYYENQNTSYVILGGDSDPENAAQDVIPHRGFYVNCGETDYDIPADMYYACLDGTWNDDNDNMWGESNEADLYAEVAVGRICVDNAAEIEQQTHKLMMYGSNPVEENLEEFLMIGEYLWPGTYGGQYMNEVAEGGNHNGYTTEGFSDNITVNTLYEMDYNWSSNDLYNALNAGVNMVHHLGHGNPIHCFNIENSNLTTNNLTNNGITAGYYTAYSQACYSGAFDNRDFSPGSYYNEDCFCEKITTMTTAASSFIANSRYGWGMQGSTNGASQYFHRQYVDAVFGEDITLIGPANNDSKEDNAAYINSDSVVRWCCYELNLLGDPTMDIWTAIPGDMEVSVPAAVQIGMSEISISTNVTGARVGILQDGTLLGRGITNSNGDVNVILDDPLLSPEPLDAVITAHNYNRWEGVIIVVSDQPYVIYEAHTLSEITGNGDGLADYNETLSMNLELHNLGTQPATGVEITVSTLDACVTFIDNSEIIGTINSETILEIIDAISFSLSDNIPDQHIIQFMLTVTGDGGEQWNSDFEISVNAPALVYGGLLIDDSFGGDNDGILDPGENVAVSFNILNEGHSLSPAASLQLSCNNNGINIIEGEVLLGEIAAGETASGIFNMEIGSEIEIGTPVAFNLICLCDNYTILEDFMSPVGLIIEDFESGDFETYNWEFGGSADWTINDEAYEGIYCARSGIVNNSQNSILRYELSVLFDAEISFFKKVSSEEGGDKLRFIVDGEMLGEWSGNEDWGQESFYIRYGQHTLEWIYLKDYSSSSGDDCAWLDNIVFPPIGIPSSPVLQVDPAVVNLECYQGDILQSVLQLCNNGGGTILYDLRMEMPRERSVADCYVTNSTPYYEPGETATWYFTVYNESADNEWVQEVDLQFPAGITLTDAQDFYVAPGRTMFWDDVTGEGVLTTWTGSEPNGAGVLRTGEHSSAAAYVTIAEDIGNAVEIGYTIFGDGYGYEPHEVSGSIPMSYPLYWIALDQLSGSLNSNEIDNITLTIDATELEPGVHICEILISSGDIDGDVHIPVSLHVISTDSSPDVLPAVTELTGCYPNPFNPETTISFSIAEDTENSMLSIYNVKGQLVRTLVNNVLPAGNHFAVWNGRDNSDNPVASGVYFYRFQAGDCDQSQKMILLK